MATYREYSREFCDKHMSHLQLKTMYHEGDTILVNLEWLISAAPHLAYNNPLTVGQCVSKVNDSFVEYAVVKDISMKCYNTLKISMWVNGSGEIEGCAVSNCSTIQFNDSKEWTTIKEEEFDKRLKAALNVFISESNINISLT